MTVDRGELRYNIKVEDNFTGPIRKFRQELLLAKSTIDHVKESTTGFKNLRVSIDGARNATKQFNAEQKQGLAEERQVRAAQIQKLREIQAVQKQNLANEKIRASLTKEIKAEQEKATRIAKEQAKAAADAAAAAERAAAAARELRIQEQERQIRSDTKRTREEELRKLRQIQEVEKQRLANDKIRASITQEIAARTEAEQQSRIQGLQAGLKQAQATEKQRKSILTEIEKEKTARARAAVEAEKASKKAARDQLRLSRGLQETESSVNRVAFTFRRLFGILAAFALARQGAAGFGSLITSGIQFNKTLEDSQTGLAGVFAATGEVRDAQGQVVQGAQAFAIAQKEAARQQQLLRKDALLTAATFEQLLNAFQTATGPGLEAGLNLDQIRQLSVSVSQAAAALGIAQDQLSEEIRSLLTGTGNLRTSRIFAVLFGSNEELRKARESGKLFETLQNRLAAFGTAAEAVQRTFTGLINRLNESINIAAGFASVDLFAGLKQSLDEISSIFVQVRRDARGVITSIEPRPETVAILKQIFDFLDGIRQSLRAIANEVRFEDLQRSLTDFLVVLRAGLDLVGAFVAGFAAGARDVLSILAPFAKLVSEIGPLLALFIRLRVTLAAIQAITSRIVALSAIWKATTVANAAAMTEAELKTAQMARGTKLVTIALLGAAAATIPLVQSLFDAELSLEQSARIIGLSFVNGLQDVGTEFSILSSRASEFFGIFNKEVRDQKGVVKSLADDVGKFGAAFLAGTFDLLGGDDTANAIRERITKGILADDETIAKAGEDRVQREFALREKLRKEQADREVKFAAELGAILAEGVAGPGLEARAKEVEDLIRRLRTDVEQEGTIGPKPTVVTQDQKDKLLQQEEQVALLRAEVVLQTQLLEIENQRLAPAEKATALIRAEIQSLQARLVVLQTSNRIEFDKETKLAAQARGTEAIAFQQARLNSLKNEQLLKEEQIALAIKKQQEELETARLIAEGSFGEGLSEGFKQFSDEMLTEFQLGLKLAKQALDQFVDLAANAIVDAFDPTADGSLREKFARFLQDLAREIFRFLVSIAVQKAILGLGSLLGGGGGASSVPAAEQPFGLAEGGSVPGGKATPAPARPAGLDPRDTTNIWAQPGEFMMQLAAVGEYGRDVMAAINEGLIDPTTLRSLAGLGSHRTVRRSSRNGAGYATGGVIQPTGFSRAPLQQQVTRADQNATPPIALVAGNEQSMDRLLAGGKRAMLDFIASNAPAIDGLLAQNRR